MSERDPAALEADFTATLAAMAPGPRLAVAASGGSDSTALMLLSAAACRRLGVDLVVATVDHGLRPEAATEAEAVGGLAARLGAAHAVLRPPSPLPESNVSSAARDARYALLRSWRLSMDAPVMAVGHTEDDLVETFLLRLARGSGVDGLAAMAAARPDDPDGADARLRLIRPLLHVRRATLQAYCRECGVDWIDDPSNVDAAFQRSRVRGMLPLLADLGLAPERLAATARRLSRARSALEAQTAALAAAAAAYDPHLGLVRLRRAELAAAPREIALRLFSRSLEAAAGQRYPPRLAALERALDAALSGAAAGTLHGARIQFDAAGDSALIFRELAACAPPVAVPDAGVVWDGRFRAAPAAAAGTAVDARDLRIGPLGLGVGAALARRHPDAALAASPAVWAADALLAAPAAGLFSPEIDIQPLRRGVCSAEIS